MHYSLLSCCCGCCCCCCFCFFTLNPSWPQAAISSSPRLFRMVQTTPLATTAARKALTTCSEEGTKGDPSKLLNTRRFTLHSTSSKRPTSRSAGRQHQGSENAAKQTERPSKVPCQSHRNHFVHFSIIWWLLSTIFWSFHFLERMNEREIEG